MAAESIVLAGLMVLVAEAIGLVDVECRVGLDQDDQSVLNDHPENVDTGSNHETLQTQP